jgi:hypothetical protein
MIAEISEAFSSAQGLLEKGPCARLLSDTNDNTGIQPSGFLFKENAIVSTSNQFIEKLRRIEQLKSRKNC